MRRCGEVLDLTLCTANCSDYINFWHVLEELSINPLKTKVAPFTKKRALTRLQPWTLGGLTISFSDEAKYLEVIFYKKLISNSQLKRIRQRATIALMGCRKLCEKNWGLKPK